MSQQDGDIEEENPGIGAALLKIYDLMADKEIDTLSPWLTTSVSQNWDPLVTKTMERSILTDTWRKELIKSKAIVDPKGYIADRAKLIRSANTEIGTELNNYALHLNTKEIAVTHNQKKALLDRKLAELVNDRYMEINLDYPITNLAENIQQSLNSASIAPKNKAPPVRRRKAKKKKN